MDKEDLMVCMDDSIFDEQKQKVLKEDNIEIGYNQEGYSQEDLMVCMNDSIFDEKTNEPKLELVLKNN